MSKQRRRGTLMLLGGLYISQFLGVGFFYTGLVAILRDRGAALEQLSTIQVLGLIWAVKFLWAPLLDRYGSPRHGHYRGWLLVLQPAIVVALLLMIPLDPVRDFGPLIAVAGLVVLMSATQDIAADALAVRALDAGDRGLGNGIQVAGGYVGNILGGGAVLIVYDNFGWPAAVITLAAFTAIPVWQVLRYREAPREVTADRPSFRAIVSVFRVPGVARWTIGVLPLLWIGTSAAYAMITPMLVDTGWSLSTIGVVTTIIGGSLAVAAAAGSGAMVRRFGRRRTLLGFAGLQAVAALVLITLAADGVGVLVAGAAVCLMNVAYAATSTIVYTVNMDLCRTDSAGTDFTVLTSFAFFASLLAGALALNVAGAVGYGPVLAGSAVLITIAVGIAARVYVDTAQPASLTKVT